jgi:hypothetical protein
MPKWMDQNLFDIGAFKITGVWLMTTYHGEKYSFFDQAVSEVVQQYRLSYPGDVLFEKQWKEIPSILNNVLEKLNVVASKRAETMLSISEIALKINPDGSPINKKFGIFGGTWFAGSHPDPTFRVQICEKNLARYFVAARFRAMSRS